MDHGDVTTIWAPADILKMLGSKVKWKHLGYTPKFQEKIEFARKNLIKDKKPWPHADSVFIHNDIIYVYMR